MGGPRFRIGGGGGGGGRAGKLFADCKLIGAPAPNQCQIITFLKLKTDNIAKLRMELKSTLLEIPSNKMKGDLVLMFYIDIQGKSGWEGGGDWPPTLFLCL